MSAAANGEQTERRLFLIDGPSLVYRAFFALPESIATSTGVPTNAIFGFASMLVKIVTEYGVCPTVVAWDAGTSGRTELFPEYKAQRRSRPDLLKQQWPAMEPLVEAFGYSNVKVEGYEADDVIASLAARAMRADPPVPVTIVTGDRDVFQLIDERGLVEVMATARGITDTKVYDRQAVIDRYGIPPELIPDFYGLKGDTSDNIPGVPGIGDKTASDLIQRYGTLGGGARAHPRHQRRQAQTEPARARRGRAHLQAAGHRRSRRPARLRPRPPRPRASPTARACARCSASTSCATRCAASRRRSARRSWRCRRAPREVRLSGRVRARGGRPTSPRSAVAAGELPELCISVRAPETPEGALFAEGAGWRFAVALTPAGGACRERPPGTAPNPARRAGGAGGRCCPRCCAATARAPRR